MRRARASWLRAAHVCWLLVVAVVASPARAAPPIGYARIHGRIPEDQLALEQDVRDAFAAHQYERAAELSERLANAAPGFMDPLYNGACARSRLGAFEPAYQRLEEVMRTDLVGYEQLYRTDPDLAAFRASPWGRRLDGEIAQIRSEVRRWLARGIAAVRYVLRGLTRPGGLESLRFQPGIYVHALRRFIPLAAEVDRGEVATQLVSLRHGVAFGASAEDWRLEVLASPAPTDLETRMLELRGGDGELELAPARGGVWWRYVEPWRKQRSVSEAPGEGEQTAAPWNFFAALASDAAPRGRPEAGARLRLSREGALLLHELTGVVVNGRTLERGGPSVTLSAGHERASLQWVVPTARGEAGLAISLQRCAEGVAGCDASGNGHAIDVIGAGRAGRAWLHGAGTAVAAYEPGGAVYIQLSSTANWSTLRRYARAGAEEFELIMPYVLLVAALPGSARSEGKRPRPILEPQSDPFALEPARPGYGR